MATRLDSLTSTCLDSLPFVLTTEGEASFRKDAGSVSALLATISAAVAVRCQFAGVAAAVVFVIAVRVVVTVEAVITVCELVC